MDQQSEENHEFLEKVKILVRLLLRDVESNQNLVSAHFGICGAPVLFLVLIVEFIKIFLIYDILFYN